MHKQYRLKNYFFKKMDSGVLRKNGFFLFFFSFIIIFKFQSSSSNLVQDIFIFDIRYNNGNQSKNKVNNDVTNSFTIRNCELPRKVELITVTSHKPYIDSKSEDHEERSVDIPRSIIIIVHSEDVEQEANTDQKVNVSGPGTPFTSGDTVEFIQFQTINQVASNVSSKDLKTDPENTFDWVHFLADHSVNSPGRPPVGITEASSEDDIGNT